MRWESSSRRLHRFLVFLNYHWDAPKSIHGFVLTGTPIAHKNLAGKAWVTSAFLSLGAKKLLGWSLVLSQLEQSPLAARTANFLFHETPEPEDAGRRTNSGAAEPQRGRQQTRDL